jgi:hypothetical protein
MGFWRREPERRAERERRKAERKEAWAQRQAEILEKAKAEREARTQREIDAMKALVQPGEELDAVFRTTGELVMKKYVLVTSSRVIVGATAGSSESFPYGQIISLDTNNFMTRNLSLSVVGRKEKVELSFHKNDEPERDQLRDAISNRLFTSRAT